MVTDAVEQGGNVPPGFQDAKGSAVAVVTNDAAADVRQRTRTAVPVLQSCFFTLDIRIFRS